MLAKTPETLAGQIDTQRRPWEFQRAKGELGKIFMTSAASNNAGAFGPEISETFRVRPAGVMCAARHHSTWRHLWAGNAYEQLVR
jgi:hypothetical protein